MQGLPVFDIYLAIKACLTPIAMDKEAIFVMKMLVLNSDY